MALQVGCRDSLLIIATPDLGFMQSGLWLWLSLPCQTAPTGWTYRAHIA